MGRSVSWPCGASTVVYGTLDWDDEVDWDYHVQWFQELVKTLFPSTWEQDAWVDREDHAFMGNNHALFGISEYCGLLSYWVLPRHNAGCNFVTHYNPGLSDAWCARIAPKFTKAFAALRKLGTMSNGEGVYQRIDA
ncbi:hypothetical protein [Tsuneonella sp. HG222]